MGCHYLEQMFKKRVLVGFEHRVMISILSNDNATQKTENDIGAMLERGNATQVEQDYTHY